METYICSLIDATPAIPQDGIASRTFLKNDHVKSLLFSFDAGQELSEHTSSHPAIIHILQGEAEVQLGEEIHQAQANSWMYMPPNLPHRVTAQSPVTMLLILLQKD